MMRRLICLAMFGLTACSGAQETEYERHRSRDSIVVVEDSSSVLTSPIVIDENSNDILKIQAIIAINNWSEATGQTFKPEYIAIDSVVEGQRNAIVSITSEHPLAVDYDNANPGYFVLGMHTSGTMYIVVDRIGLYTLPVLMHEIGHYIGLPHSKNPDDVMIASSVTNACVSYENLALFCQQWGCEEIEATCY